MKSLKTFSSLIFLLLMAVSGFGQRLVDDPAFSPNINGPVEHVKVLPDQKILIAGNFTAVDDQPRFKIARLNADGSLDTTFNANWIYESSNLNNVIVKALTVLPDGKIYFSGSFASSGVNVPDKILRLNPDGSLDPSLTSPPLIEGIDFAKSIRKIEPLADGKFLACGYFATVNGNSRPYLARFNNDGSFDSSLTVELDNECLDVAVQPDGKYLVAGTFTTVNGSTKLGLVRFNTDDSIDTGFNAFSVNNQFTLDKYFGIRLLDDGTMYALHNPASISGGILRLNADGSLRLNLLTYARPAVDLEILSNGKIIAVGDFFDAGPRDPQSSTFNRFTPDGRHDGSVTVEFFGAYLPMRALEIAANENIIVGGAFTSVQTNGVSVNKSILSD
jgi:hypothetical protein